MTEYNTYLNDKFLLVLRRDEKCDVYYKLNINN